MYDAASGSAIRHLVDAGHSVEQIMGELCYPTPRERVEQTVYRYMMESGILLTCLPLGEAAMKEHVLNRISRGGLRQYLRVLMEKNGEMHSYMYCPFGGMLKRDEEALVQWLSVLTKGEREYIYGIRWEQDVMYHRLSGRMFEIGLQLAVYPDRECRFYFLKSGEVVVV